MSSNDIAISVQDLSKRYEIYDTPRDRLKQFVLPPLQRLAGRLPKQYYREFWALKNVSFQVKMGETVGIIGRNGSGKSTLLQMICGTLNPSSGSIQTTGRIGALLELGSGFNPEFTGRENVYLNATVLGLDQEEINSRFDDIAAFADIGEFIEQPVKTYSSGMVVRLAFAVQAIIDPDIFVVDEALAVGDEKFQRKCFARIETLKSQGSSILFVSHSPASIMELCDRTLLLEHGSRLMYSRAPAAIRAYQMLIYAPNEDQQRMVQEYRVLDQTTSDITNLEKYNSVVIATADPNDVFDPGLIPATTTAYPVQGAEIVSMKILDVNGHNVNILHSGGTYQFLVYGRILESLSAVCFGISIRSVSGLIITGQRYPEEGKFIEQIESDENVKVSFSFKMDLLPGSYFVGGGIWSVQQTLLAHRVVDAIMFRVAHNEKQRSFGYVDCVADDAEFEII